MRPNVFPLREPVGSASPTPTALLKRFSLGLSFVAAAVLLRWLLDPLLENKMPTVALYWAVAAAVWFAGSGPALLAAMLGFLASVYLFVPPGGHIDLSVEFTIGAVTYALTCVSIVALGETGRRAMSRAQHARNELQSRVNELQTLLDILPCGVWIADQKGTCVSANRAACGLLQVDPTTQPEHFDARICEALQYFEKGSPIAPKDMPLQKVARTGRPIMGFEHGITLRDGTSKTIYGNAAPLFEKDGSIRGVIGAALDFTDRKRMETELARHRDHLEEIVMQRTKSLRKSEELLRRSERLASLGVLGAGIAHEINNPLNSILLMAQYMLRGKDRDIGTSRETLEKIKVEAQRGGQIIKNILKFARDEKSVRVPSDLNETARQAAAIAQTYIAAPKTCISLDLDANIPRVVMNSTEIEQVLVNLVKNASEASPSPVHVRIQTRAHDHEVILRVIDDGPGMPEEVRRHIFDPFFTTKRTSGGSGLGLSLCHGIILDHDGAIDVESSMHEGTTFTIRLPAAISESLRAS